MIDGLTRGIVARISGCTQRLDSLAITAVICATVMGMVVTGGAGFSSARAQPATAQNDPVELAERAGKRSTRNDDEILVVGERQGPRLWRVYRPAQTGDAAPSPETPKTAFDPEIFVLATVNFTPEDFEFYDAHIARILNESIEVLTGPEADLEGANRARVFGTALNTLIFNRDRLYMPKGTTLADRVGPDLAAAYDRERARQSVLAEQHRARRKARKKQKADTAIAEQSADEATENKPDAAAQGAIEKAVGDLDESRLHPFFQSQRLVSDATDAAGLVSFESINKRIKKLAKRTKSRPRPKLRPITEYDVVYADLKKGLKSIKSFSEATNIRCIDSAVKFSRTRVQKEQALAAAWARGDVAFLQANAVEEDIGADADEPSCFESLSDEFGALKTFDGQEIDDVDIAGLWVDALDAAMRERGVRLALLPAGAWLREDGVRDRLIGLGYSVDGPP